MVFIHYCEENSNKVIRLELFLMEENIPCMVVKDDDTVINLLQKKLRNHLNKFIMPPNYRNGNWIIDQRLLPGTLLHTVEKIPTIKTDDTSDIMKYFQDIGSIANADKDKLSNYWNKRKPKRIYEFFR